MKKQDRARILNDATINAIHLGYIKKLPNGTYDSDEFDNHFGVIMKAIEENRKRKNSDYLEEEIARAEKITKCVTAVTVANILAAVAVIAFGAIR